MPSTTTFAPIRKAIAKFDRPALIALVGELHALNAQNRDFLATRFVSSGNGLDKYKKIIRKALCPNWPNENTSISFRDARKAIGDYRKATGDTEGLAELYVFAAECATQLTLDYGDMDEPFYDSLERMYAAAVKTVKTLATHAPQTAAPLIHRLRALVTKTENIGWGLHYFMADEFSENFDDTDDTDDNQAPTPA